MNRSGIKAERHIAEHHHEIVIGHGTETLCLTNPLQHLCILCPLRIVIVILIEIRVLRRFDELVGILNQVVGCRPELVDFSTLVITVIACVGVVRMGLGSAGLKINIAIIIKGQLIGITIQVVNQCLGIDTVQSTLYLRFLAEDELLRVGRRCIYVQKVVARCQNQCGGSCQ